MISLLAAALRLLAIAAVLVWLPGVIAARRPLRPVRLLHVLTLGAFVHVLALVLTAFVAGSVATATWLLPTLTFPCAFLLRAMRRVDDTWDPPSLRVWPALGVTGIVLLAGLMRWFHNFHYDDTAHLLYLTELTREDLPFPDQFFLQLSALRVPGLGDGALILSRYPFWALSYTVLAHLAHVVPGDAYLLVGLGVLALTAGQITALASRAWSPAAGVLWLLGVLASGLYFSDNLLNFGGYPFQIGKLFLLLAGTAFVTAWVTGEAAVLESLWVGVFIAPLVHPNNAIGAVSLMVLASGFALARPHIRRPFAMAAVLAGALLCAATAGSLATGGFLQWSGAGGRERVYDIVLAPEPPDLSAAPPLTGIQPSPSRQPPVHGARDAVLRRMRLFVHRGVPFEVVVPMIVAICLSFAATRLPWLPRTIPPVMAVLIALVIVASVAECASAVLTSAYKPGYFIMRHALQAVAPQLPVDRPVVTDPITDILGRAAGWPLIGEPRISLEEQTALIALFRPDVTGQALAAVLRSVGRSTIVANEWILGPEPSRKLLASEAVVARSHTGAIGLPSDPLDAPIAALARDVRGGRIRTAIDQVMSLAPRALGQISRNAAVVVFTYDADTTAPLNVATLGPLVRQSSSDSGDGAFMNGFVLTVPGPVTCASRLSIDVDNAASFHSRLLVVPLDSLPRAGRLAFDLGPGRSTLRMRLDAPNCDAAPKSFLLHTDFWWDARFTVESARWEVATAP